MSLTCNFLVHSSEGMRVMLLFLLHQHRAELLASN